MGAQRRHHQRDEGALHDVRHGPGHQVRNTIILAEQIYIFKNKKQN